MCHVCYLLLHSLVVVASFLAAGALRYWLLGFPNLRGFGLLFLWRGSAGSDHLSIASDFLEGKRIFALTLLFAFIVRCTLAWLARRLG